MSVKDDKAGSTPLRAEDLNQLVYQDDLTKTFNRRFFYQYLKEEVAWSSRAPEPLTLLMIDLDHFKQINDTYGHLEGDNALLHVSRVFLGEVGDRGHVVRYAGDEFSILLPNCPKEAGRDLGERILKRVSIDEFRIESREQALSLGLSVGVSTFPDDARDPKLFIEEADRALYASKRNGRNRVTVANEETRLATGHFPVLDVFPCPRTVGRETTLEMFRGVFDTTNWVSNTAILVRGGPGMGKSRVLREVASEGMAREFQVYSHGCLPRDTGQPFDLLARVLEGFGTGIPGEHRARGLSHDAVRAIRGLVPGFFPEDDSEEEEAGVADDFARHLLDGCQKFLRKVAAGSPLLLLLDDLQFADAPSLGVIGRLLRSDVVPLILAATLRERAGKEDPYVRVSLGLASEEDHPNLPIVEARLTPLSPAQVGEAIRAIFKGIQVRRTFVHRIWELTRGNPLHAEEILKWLVQNEYVARAGEGWEVREVPWDEIPTTLEDAVRGHLGGIDGEADEVITNAAALGARFDLETIRRISEKGTGEVLEMLDRGADANIIRPSDPLDDNRFEFLSSYAQELKEAETDEKRLREIHGRIAGIEEKRNEGHLHRVYGRLQYHYGRSNDQARADYFRGLARGRWKDGVWPDAGVDEEPASPVRRARARIQEADTPLSAREMDLMRNVLRYFAATLKNRLIYPPGSRIIQESTRDVYKAMQEVFKTCRVITLSNAKDEMCINGVNIDPRSFVTGNREFMELLKKYSIQSITITRDVEIREIEGFRDLLYLRSKEDDLDPGFWDRNLDEKEIRHLSIDQRVYVVAGTEAMGGGDGEEEDADRRPEKDEEPPGGLSGEVDGYLSKCLDEAFAGEGQEPLDEFLRQVLHLLESGTPREKEIGGQLFGEFMQRLQELRDRDRLLSVTERLTEKLDRDIPERAFPPIARALAAGTGEFLKRGNYEVSGRIIRFLGHQEGKDGVSREVAREARRALNDVIRSGAFDLIIADLISEDPSRQGEAREVLLGFNDLVVDPLIRVVKESDDYRTRKFTSLILHELGERAVKQLKRELNESTVDEEYRRILGILDTFPDDFEEQLLAALCHTNPVIRSEAAKLLRKVRGDIDRILLDVLKTADGAAASEAMMQLGRMKLVDAVDPILARLGDGEGVSDPVLYEGCMALGRIGDERGVDFLKRILAEGRIPFLRKRRASKVRFAAAWALAQIGSPGACEALKKACRDRDSDIRALATRTVKA